MQVCVVLRCSQHLSINQRAQNGPVTTPNLLVAILQLPCQFMRCASGVVCRSSDEHDCNSASSSDNRSHPVGHIPPIHCERAYRHRAFPLSLLEAILP